MKVVTQHPKNRPLKESTTFIKMESTTDADPSNDDKSDSPATPEDAVKMLTPVPSQEKIRPPLSSTLGGDDVVIPVDKH